MATALREAKHTKRKRSHEQVTQDVEKWLAAGNTITVVPPGASGDPDYAKRWSNNE